MYAEKWQNIVHFSSDYITYRCIGIVLKKKHYLKGFLYLQHMNQQAYNLWRLYYYMILLIREEQIYLYPLEKHAICENMFFKLLLLILHLYPF